MVWSKCSYKQFELLNITHRLYKHTKVTNNRCSSKWLKEPQKEVQLISIYHYTVLEITANKISVTATFSKYNLDIFYAS